MTPYIAPGISSSSLYWFVRNKPNRDLRNKQERIEYAKMLRERIIVVVSDYIGVSVVDVKGKSQKKLPTEARHISMHIMRMNTKMTYQAIGLFFNRDHSTVITNVEKISGYLEVSKDFREKYSEIKQNI